MFLTYLLGLIVTLFVVFLRHEGEARRGVAWHFGDYLREAIVVVLWPFAVVLAAVAIVVFWWEIRKWERS